MKKLFAIILFAIVCNYAMAYDFSAVCSTGQTLYYNITSNVEPYTVEVTSENTEEPYYTTYPEGELVIPETVEYNNVTYSVTSIGEFAFSSCNGLTSVTIPDSITSIGERAFYGCTGLTIVNFNAENCTTMGSESMHTFDECTSLTTLNIGENVTNIPDYAFYNCSGLTGSLTFPNSVTSIGVRAFNSCTNITDVTIGSMVTSIGDYAFQNCSELTAVYYTGNITGWCGISFGNANTSNPVCLAHNLYINNELVTDLIIPEVVTEIKPYSFFGATCLSSVTIPYTVTSISGSAFQSCSGLTAVYYAGDIADWCGISFGNEAANPLYAAHNLYIDNELVTNLEIPNTITQINDYAFEGATCFTSVIIPNTVLSIGRDAFTDCSGLTEITIPNSVTSIGNTAFWACGGLTTVTIGNSVGNIGSSAFSQCNNITEIFITANTPPALDGSSVFTSTVRSTATLYVSCNASAAYGSASGWSDFDNLQERFGYTLNVSTENDQQGTASITQQPSCSDNSAIITATPATGYRFLQWSDGNTDNPRTVVVTSDITYTAGFKAIYIITATAGENGTISPSGEITVDEGENQSFTIAADEDYRIASVMVDGTENVTDQLVDGVYTFENVTASHSIEATFETIPSFTITVSVNNDAYGSVSGGGTYEEGSEVVITATPYEGYRFVQWNDGHVGNPRTIIVTSDSTFVANFVSDSIFSTITESFEPYELGSYMSEVAAPRWELWTDDVMGGLVSDEQANYGSQSMKIYRDGSTDTDVVLNVNDLTTGRYRVEFYMYVPTDKTGYYNIQQDNNGPDSKWGIQLTFNGSEVTIDANGNHYYHLYDPDSWMRIIHYIDLDNDWADLYMDDELVVAYQWSKGQNGDGTTCKFDAIDFYSQTSNNQSGLFYIDDITISQVSATDAPTNLTATVQNELDVLLSWAAVDNEIFVDHYSISRDGYEIATTTETTYIDEHLYPMTYNYQVRAYCGTEIGYSASSNTAQATIEGGVERQNVLVEVFSYRGCGYCPYAAKALDNMEAAGTFDIIVLDQHITDTYGYTESNNRFNYWAGKDNMFGQNYGFDGTPSTVFDGYIGMAGATTTGESAMQDAYTTYYNHVKTINSLYSLNAEFEQTEPESRTFALNVTAEKHSEYFGDDQIVVMAALAEDIDYDWGVAGKINNLVRVLYPDANGTEATFDGNNRFSTSFSITISEEYDISKCKVVVWVENHTQGRVMQSKRFNGMDFYNLQAQQYTITVLSNNDAYGSVSGSGTYYEGDIATLMAMPYDGYCFTSWDDDNTDNPRSITVSSDSTFIANFSEHILFTIDTTVSNFVTIGDHTFYSTGNYTFTIPIEIGCDTIVDLQLRVLAEPVYDIGPNPTKSLLNINSDGFISAVEFYSTTGQLVMRKEVNGHEAEFDMEGLVDGVYILRIFGEESSLPSVSKVVKE